jgi:hypothetical protein
MQKAGHESRKQDEYGFLFKCPSKFGSTVSKTAVGRLTELGLTGGS